MSVQCRQSGDVFTSRFAGAGRYFAALVLNIVTFAQSPALAADSARTRMAVVVSNADYSQLGTLRNPASDGQLVATSLRAAGFTVTYLHDLNNQQFRSALRQVARDSSKFDVTLFYYAGHGVQMSGINYLLPVDVPVPDLEDDVRLASISADEVILVIKSPYKILVLDACRDNPILRRALRFGRSASYKRGLAAVAPPAEAVGGVFIAYSTQTDAAAMDGDSANSPFAESFARYVGNRVSIDDMFAMVTRDVLKKTHGFQRPFKYASLDTVFCLPGDCVQASASPTAVLGATSSLSPSQARELFAKLNATTATDIREQIEEQLWQKLRAVLPSRVSYGTLATAGGKKVVHAFFEPATATTDGHRASATIATGSFADGSAEFDPSISADIQLNCDMHDYVRTRTQEKGSIFLLSQEQQKADKQTIAPGSVIASLEGALCSAPLRLMPLWAIDNVEWTAIGVGIAVSSILYRDPIANDIWYVFERLQLPATDELGQSAAYGWLAVNCKTKEFSGNTYYGVTKSGHVATVNGNPVGWALFKEASPAANAYVLLCDKPSGRVSL